MGVHSLVWPAGSKQERGQRGNTAAVARLHPEKQHAQPSKAVLPAIPRTMQRPQHPSTFAHHPGRDFLLARLHRAQAVPPAQRTPEVAAFVEAMQLDEEACALLPLMVDADDRPQPALPADEATAQRVLLASLKIGRMIYVCGERQPPSSQIFNHMGVYHLRGCGALYPPLQRCIAELPTLLRRSSSSRAQRTLSYLWLYGVIMSSPLSHSAVNPTFGAAQLRELGDALAAADLESLDQQLCQLQGVTSASGLLVTSKQLRWTCYLGVYIMSVNSREEALQHNDEAQCALASLF